MAGATEHQALLGRVPFFAGLASEDLQRFAERASVRPVAAGETLIEQGSPPDGLYVVISGRFEVSWRGAGAGDSDEPGQAALNVCGPGDVMGEMSLLEQAPRSASVRALEAGAVLCLAQGDFHEILRSNQAALSAILGTIARRLRNNEVTMQRGFRLASLGRLAAGLAHELNNPASAVKRSAERLAQQIGALPLPLPLPPDQVGSSALSPIERAEREEALSAALGARGLHDAHLLAPELVAVGLDAARLTALSPAEVRFLALGASSRALVTEITDGARRISAIVQSVKTYAYLGRAPLTEVDICAGLDSTLTMLAHAMRAVTVTRDYQADLPRIEAHGSELNQVWTNLIDNAVDALGGRGELVVRAFAIDPGHVAVEIIDSGPGIAPEARAHLFEPFFTTKPLGAGSGLGLHISHNIVVVHHGGEIQVDSRHGRTCFRVLLPISRERPR